MFICLSNLLNKKCHKFALSTASDVKIEYLCVLDSWSDKVSNIKTSLWALETVLCFTILEHFIDQTTIQSIEQLTDRLINNENNHCPSIKYQFIDQSSCLFISVLVLLWLSEHLQPFVSYK